MINKLLRYKVILVILILTLVFLPGVLVGDLDSHTDAIITSVGIDKDAGGYEVTVQYVVPTPSGQFNRRLDVLSNKAEEINAVLAGLSLKLGKPIGLSHCQSVIISDSVASDGDIAKVYDYFSRFKLNTNYIALIYTPKSAKDFLKASAEVQNEVSLGMGSEGDLTDFRLRGMQTFLRDFYIGYFSPSGCSRMGCIDLKEDESSAGGESSGGGGGSGGPGESSGGSSGGGGSSGQSGSGGKKTISNEGQAVVFKKGKKVLMLEENQVMQLGWFLQNVKSGNIVVEHVDGEQYNDAKVGIEIEDKRIRVKVYFKDGAPVYELGIKINARVSEVVQESYNLENFDILKENVNKVLRTALEGKIKQDFEDFIKLSQENNFDIIDVYNSFHKFKTREFRDFIDRLPNPDDYINHITFKVTVDIMGGI